MLDRRVKYRHVQCLVEIDRQKSLKRAAERLYLTQPAISKTLKELEEIAGAKLLERNRSGVALTPAGEVFLRFARMSIAALQQAFDGVEQIARQAPTRLNIGALPSVAARLMPQVVDAFNRAHPATVLQISIGAHKALTDRLRNAELDLVIGRLGPPDSMQGISFTQLYQEQVEFVVRPGHPALAAPDIRRIGQWLVIYPEAGSAIRPLVEQLLVAHGVGELPRRIETVSGAFGRVFMRDRDAIWIISGGVVANEIAAGDLARLPFDTRMTRGAVGLMARPGGDPSPIDQSFRQIVQQHAAYLSVEATPPDMQA